MLVINRLTKPGGIKRVVLKANEVVVTTRDGEKITYKKEGSK